MWGIPRFSCRGQLFLIWETGPSLNREQSYTPVPAWARTKDGLKQWAAHNEECSGAASGLRHSGTNKQTHVNTEVTGFAGGFQPVQPGLISVSQWYQTSLLHCEALLLGSVLIITWISVKVFKDVTLGSRKLVYRLFFSDQTMKQLIREMLGGLIHNEKNHQLYFYFHFWRNAPKK